MEKTSCSEPYGSMPPEILLRNINETKADDLNILLQVILERYREVFPEDEIIFISVPRRNRNERKRLLQAVLALIKKEEAPNRKIIL